MDEPFVPLHPTCILYACWPAGCWPAGLLVPRSNPASNNWHNQPSQHHNHFKKLPNKTRPYPRTSVATMVMEKKKKDEKTVHEDYSFGGRKDADLFRSSHEESSSDLETNSRHGEQDELFTSMETKRVNRSKIFVYLALLCTAVAVSTVTYIFLSREQENNMQVEVR